MDIRPKAICRQLFAIREQISGELINDLRELPRKDNELSKARALYDEDRPSFDESRLGDADGSRASPFRAATYELALQLCTAFAVEMARAPGGLLLPQRLVARRRDAPLRHGRLHF